MEKGIARAGSIFGTNRIRAYNRTGAAISRGDQAALNYDFGNGTYNTIDGVPTSDIDASAVAVTTENASRVMVTAAEDIPVDTEGNWITDGARIDVLVTGATNKGEFLHGTNAAAGLTPLTKTELDSVTVPTGIVGIALETRADAGLVKARYHGEAWMHLVGGGG